MYLMDKLIMTHQFFIFVGRTIYKAATLITRFSPYSQDTELDTHVMTSIRQIDFFYQIKVNLIADGTEQQIYNKELKNRRRKKKEKNTQEKKNASLLNRLQIQSSVKYTCRSRLFYGRWWCPNQLSLYN